MKPLRFAVIGHPIRQSASPAMHMAAFRALSLPHTYEAVDCPGEVAVSAALDLVRRGGIAGLNVTAPYKREVMKLADQIHGSAEAAGAANTVVPLAGGKVAVYNTDVAALTDELTRLAPLKGTAVIVGAGGAASAALAACQAYGMRVIGMTTRSWAGSEAVYESEIADGFRVRGALTTPWPAGEREHTSKMSTALRLHWLDLAASADVIIQATSVGVRDPASPDLDGVIPWADLPMTTVAIDLVYGPRPTSFLRAARARLSKVENGVGMLVGQGMRSLSLWLGVDAPRDVMTDAVHRRLTETLLAVAGSGREECRSRRPRRARTGRTATSESCSCWWHWSSFPASCSRRSACCCWCWATRG